MTVAAATGEPGRQVTGREPDRHIAGREPDRDVAGREPDRHGPSKQRHRGRQAGHLVGLVAALVAAAVLVALPPAGPGPASGPPPALAGIEEVWPGAQRAEIPANLADGPAYSPGFFLDVRQSIGTAPSPDGRFLRLVHRAGDGTVRELRRLPIDRAPQFGGFTRSGNVFAWSETTSDEQGTGRTELWWTDLAGGGPARRVTADVGDAVFFNSQYDMVIEDGRLHWVAVAPGERTATEIRSVALSGGPVSVRTEPGAWVRSAWPWLVSAGAGESGPVRLRNLEARKILDVPASGTELVSCSPTWCRVLVLSSDGPGRIELMRPDGSQRRPVASGDATAALVDVAVEDRFEVLSLADAQVGATGSLRLRLYDLRQDRTVTVAEGVGTVLCRGGVLWWSTGDIDATTWHTLDLRSLA